MGFFNLMRDHNSRNNIANNNHVGVVVNNKDPEQLGRVKLRIHKIHQGVSDEDLPWVTPGVQKSNQSSNQIGSLGPIPTLGAEVFVKMSDPYHLTYKGGVNRRKTKLKDFQAEDKEVDDNAQAQKEGKTQPGFDNEGDADETDGSGDEEQDYPHVDGEEDRSGNQWATNTERDTTRFKHVSGSGYSIDGNGSMNIQVANKKVGPNAKEIHPKGLTLGVQGLINVGANGDVTISGKKLKLIFDDIEIHTQKDFKVDAKKKIDLGGETLITPCSAGDCRGGKPDSVPNIPAPKSRKRPEEKTGLSENDKEY